jgi:diguanylate cyclase (GGDEF)-like protein
MRLSRVALFSYSESGYLQVVCLDGDLPEDSTPEGNPVQDMGVLGYVASTKKPYLITLEEKSPVKVPYALSPVPLRSAVAAPVNGGIFWADRDFGDLTDEEVKVIVDLCAFLEAEQKRVAEINNVVRDASDISALVEGIRSLLVAKSERECVRALCQAGFEYTRSRFALVPLCLAGTDRCIIVGIAGDIDEALLGASFSSAKSLTGLAIRNISVVPSRLVFSPSCGDIVGEGDGIKVNDGEPLCVHPIGQSLGALVMAGGSYERIHWIRSLCDATSLIIERLRLQERISKEAMIDGLTGLYNRAAFFKRFKEILAFCGRKNDPVAVLMIDADHFKSINDHFGHQVGDRALRFIAEVIAKNLRESDVAGRYGGEEFSVVLPATGLDGARLVAERIRRLCETGTIYAGGQALKITVSIGLTALERVGVLDADDIIRQADEALYRAKNLGRNRTVAWRE